MEPTALKFTPEISPCNTHFLKKAYHTGFLSIGNTGKHFHTTFGGHFKQQNHPPKSIKYAPKTKTKRQSVTLFSFGWEHACWIIQIFCHSEHVHVHIMSAWESTKNVDLGATNKFQQVQKSANIESVNNEDQP